MINVEQAQQKSPYRMSVIDRIKPDDSNKGFLRALVAAIAFMLLSGMVLVAGFLAWHYPQLAEGAKTEPFTLTGKDFYIAIGNGDHEGSKLILNALDEAKSAVISSKKAKFNASRYPIAEYKITGRTPGAAVVLYWRTVTHNQETLFAKLHWNGDYLSAYNISNEEEWKGAVTELGISVSGHLRDQPVTIEQITFRPWTVKSLLLTVWTEWNTFEGWTQKSINAIRGMPENALISPVVAAAAWCGLAIVLYTLWLFFYRRPKVMFELEVEEARRPLSQARHSSLDRHSGAGRNPSPPNNKKPHHTAFSITRQIWDFKAVVIMFMVAWFVLDGKWQVNLWRQLADTQYLFAGKSHHEQHLAAKDAQLYRFAMYLKKNLLPEHPIRLFILDSKWQSYPRLKLAYYLYPHNVFPFYNKPQPSIMKEGDFVLVLNSLPLVQYHATNKTLGSGRWKVSAQEVEKTALGGLYRIRKGGA